MALAMKAMTMLHTMLTIMTMQPFLPPQQGTNLPTDALLQDLQPRRGASSFGRLCRSGFLLRRRHLSPGGRLLLLATLWRGQLCWTHCLGEAGGHLQGDG